MSDDDNRRGPRGPRKPGGGGRSGGPGGRSGGFGGGRSGPGEGRGNEGERPARSGGFKGGGFKPAGSGGRSGGFRDAPAAGEGPARERSGTGRPGGSRFDRPRRAEDGGQRPFKPRFPREDGAGRAGRSERPDRGERPGRGERQAERSGEGFRPRGPRRDADDGAPRRFRSDGPPARSDARPHRGQGDDRTHRGPREDRRDDRRDDRPQRRDGDAPRSSSRPERRPFLPRGGNPERLASPEKAGGVERIAKVIARAGAASRREAEEMIEQGRVTVDGERIASPALDVLPTARITIDGEALPARERTRLWLYHKPSGLVSTNHDPEGRTTLFEALPEDLPRVITVGRLDINTEGLLLLTNDGGLARVLGHPETAWLRRYRVRAYGQITQDKLDAVRDGVTIDGENFGPVVATRDRETGDNTWLTVDLREGKNREVKRVLEHLGLIVNRLIRISFGPFQLNDLAEGEVEEVRTRVLREQLGEQLAAIAGADFDAAVRGENRLDRPHPHETDRSERPQRGGREARGERPRFEERGPRREAPARGFGRPESGDDKPARPRREGAYHRAREEAGDAPRDILLRAEEGRSAIWRDEDTAGMKPKRTGPRRGADPRQERASREADGSRERVRAKPIEDPKGRRVTVERLTGASPDVPRKPRYTRADFAPPGADDKPFRRPREDGDRPPRRAFGDRPPRSDGDRPYTPRGPAREGDRGPRREFDDRPPRRASGDRPPRRDGDERPPRRDSSDRPPRAEGRADRAGGFGGKAPGRGGGDISGGGKSFGAKPFGGRPSGGRPPGGGRGGPDRGGPDRGGSGGDKPRGPRKPRF